jgi:hypothetical protein
MGGLALNKRAEELFSDFPNRRISWLPREINAEADALASLAFSEAGWTA